MNETLATLFQQNGGALSTAMLRKVISEAQLRTLVRRGEIVRAWHGVYTVPNPTLPQRLSAADCYVGQPVTACLGTAAALHGFDTEGTIDIHIHDMGANHPHGAKGLVVHQRLGAPVTVVGDRTATTPAWTAIEVARTLPRPRALGTLDAALATGRCKNNQLKKAIAQQKGRRGVVAVRPLVELADHRSQSPMESEVRLLFHDAGLPPPELQHVVCDDFGNVRFVLDFAWEEVKVGVEYDSDMFHADPLAVRRDKARIGWLQDRGWLIISITVDDVRKRAEALIRRIRAHFASRRHAV